MIHHWKFFAYVAIAMALVSFAFRMGLRSMNRKDKSNG